MDKNAIKKYAVWARRELISRVSQKALQYGISEKETVPASAASVNGVVLSAEEIKQRKALIEQINAKGYEQVMEEVAYTWFNRFIALRFMEVNGYLPSHVRVFTDEDNAFRPQIITEAINLELDGLDMDKVYAWKDANDNDSLFKYLIITQCNALSPILPRMFQRIADYTELLFPDNLLREGSTIQQMIELIPEDDWKDAVQIIGWLYQFYNIEPKADVDAKVKKGIKVSKSELPAKTQIFTPDWVVRYMTENSLGRLWLEGHPNEELKSKWKYYLDEAEQEPDVQAQLAAIRKEYAAMAPEQIKCIDPCAGSGHILAYMFDVLVQIYEDYGYSAREAVRSIVENNIHGLDIDDRAAQLAYFAVMMKARQYDRRFFARKDENGNPDVPQPQVYAIIESNGTDSFALDYFINGDAKLQKAMDSVIKEMHDAKEYGSIMQITPVDFAALYARFDEVREDVHLSREIVLDSLLPLVQVAETLARKYDVVITNPPYMGNGDMNAKLSPYIQEKYPIGKSDLYSVFILRCEKMLLRNRFQAMVTMQSWMNLGAFESLRSQLCKSQDIVMLWHLDDTLLGIAYQTSAFVLRSGRVTGYRGKYDMATKADYSEQADMHDVLLGQYEATQESFLKLEGCPIAYALGPKCIDTYSSAKLLSTVLTTREGMTTGNNDRFLRLWHEVDITKKGTKWFPYNKGGEFRKWYGNDEYLVDWENDGLEMRSFKDEKTGRIRSHNYNGEYSFTEGITWSAFSSRGATFRYSDNQFLFDSKGSKGFCTTDKIKYIMAFLNSSVGSKYLSFFAGAKDKKPGHIVVLPYVLDENVKEAIDVLASECISISRNDWDSRETSWNYTAHPLVKIGATRLSIAYDNYQRNALDAFTTMQRNEERINELFISVYKVEGEVSSVVEEADVTITLPDKKEMIKGLISYAVGCMFGRYSLDVPGLAYAGGEWDDSKYTTFKADKDSIIPICDDEYFADDIVGRFIRFIEVVYGKDTLQENLRFIADALGGSGQPKDVIRNYFLNDFYADHLKVYQKRPIYWLFDSGKNNGFKALVYMHRYQPDTIARMRTDYVHEQQARYRTAIADLEQRIASASTAERVKLSKRLKTLQEQAAEIQGYEEKIHHLADQYIAIDLDDGVKKNYAIFGDVLAKIK